MRLTRPEQPNESRGGGRRVGATRDEDQAAGALGDQAALPHDSGQHGFGADVRHTLDSRNRYTAALVLRRGLLIFIALVALAAIGPAAAGACVGEAKGPRRLTEGMARQAVLCLINQRRAHAGLGALQENASLDRSAQGHTIAMVKHNSYSHGNPLRRIRHTGYLAGASAWTVGENIGWGPEAARQPEADGRLLDAQP